MTKNQKKLLDNLQSRFINNNYSDDLIGAYDHMIISFDWTSITKEDLEDQEVRKYINILFGYLLNYIENMLYMRSRKFMNLSVVKYKLNFINSKIGHLIKIDFLPFLSTRNSNDESIYYVKVEVCNKIRYYKYTKNFFKETKQSDFELHYDMQKEEENKIHFLNLTEME